MDYELYIDLLFLINFMMDFLLLRLVGKILKCSTTHGSLFLGALAGALSSCVIVAVPIPYPIIKILLFHTVVNTLMIWLGLRVKEKKLFFEALVMLYISAFLLGGILESMRTIVAPLSVLFAAALAAGYGVWGIWLFIQRQARMKKVICEVVVYTGSGIYPLKALIDTGNSLYDGVSGKSVNIVDKRTARRLFPDTALYSVRYIPYISIGRESVIPVVRVQRLQVQADREYWIEEPMIGICEENISSREEYQMILNPDILGGS
ncbi:sigma-E processing peptidase SpoIIGA [Hespellia stercorisuis]|uniref:Sporulation factor SpoIIGA n=1 Tax=Hespellia stercorisuis DSM 15480 TaxID=1121950 RepID=A0A1M6IL09_9FIRM|nr:sigma-E processing peptidase SpoIIGA [Hespellia stercorisuis]SHJ35172.1 Sporulation factor SpoIIGA [Hespellia stercorisuis DSM 15480]